ncbi:HNH endonuclease [Vibrio cholerae]|nr:HNH endonuclease [Vibrio cholerae]
MKNILSQCHEFKLSETYAYADLVRKEIFSEYSMIEAIDVASDVEKQISQPCRRTLLHDYIEAIVEKDIYQCFCGPAWDYDCVDPVLELLESHDIVFLTLEDYVADLYKDDDGEVLPQVTEEMCEKYRYEYLSEYVHDLAREKVVPLIVTEVFNLLFSDREAMMQFNVGIAEYLAVRTKRCTYWPKWLERALLHREKGVCVLCKTDLTALYNTQGKLAVDHIVPIAMGGVNDPTNLQLLCSSCNNEKSGDKIITSTKMPLYWEDI